MTLNHADARATFERKVRALEGLHTRAVDCWDVIPAASLHTQQCVAPPATRSDASQQRVPGRVAPGGQATEGLPPNMPSGPLSADTKAVVKLLTRLDNDAIDITKGRTEMPAAVARLAQLVPAARVDLVDEVLVGVGRRELSITLDWPRSTWCTSSHIG